MNKSTDQGNRRGFLSKMLVMGAGSVAFLTSSAYARGKGGRKGKGGATNLTEEQKGKLFYIYQEEKVARDVYTTLGEEYDDENTFASIKLSEQRHIDAARGLCERYSVDISEVDEDSIGNFEIDVLQELYESCVLEGEKGILNALLMGKLIEDIDIEDLQHAMSDEFGMPDDVIRVYGNLLEGSFNHLEAFETAIAREE